MTNFKERLYDIFFRIISDLRVSHLTVLGFNYLKKKGKFENIPFY